MALGATRSTILKQVLAESMRLSVASLVIGGLAAYFLTRVISSMLFGISPTDAVTYFAVSSLLIAVTLLASYLPARRAAQVDPILALRELRGLFQLSRSSLPKPVRIVLFTPPSRPE